MQRLRRRELCSHLRLREGKQCAEVTRVVRLAIGRYGRAVIARDGVLGKRITTHESSVGARSYRASIIFGYHIPGRQLRSCCSLHFALGFLSAPLRG